MEPLYRSLEIAAKTAVVVTGTRMTYEGLEHIPTTGGAVVAINHTGYVDFLPVDAGVQIIPVIVWGVHRFWTKGHPKKLGRNKFPVRVDVGAPVWPAGTVDTVMAALRDTMTTQLHRVQDVYPHPAGAYWVPRRLGGGAPTPAAAAMLEQAELARRGGR